MYKTKESPPQVFGIGLGKTATTSLNEALNILGYKSKHYPRDLNSIINGTYNAATDTLIAAEYKYLNEKFPEAKFICTLRNKSEWLQSFEKHFEKDTVRGLSKDLIALKLRKNLYGTIGFNKNLYAQKFSSHIGDILDYFSRDMNKLIFINILEHSSGENWNTLCKFLQCNMPDNILFPHLNK